MKKKKPVRSHVLQIRVTEFELNRLKGLASIYAKGNLSLFVVCAAINAPREYVTDEHRNGKKKRSLR